MSKETSGPAFPRSGASMGSQKGLSLRDYFAAKAPSVPDDFDWVDGERQQELTNAVLAIQKYYLNREWSAE